MGRRGKQKKNLSPSVCVCEHLAEEEELMARKANKKEYLPPFVFVCVNIQWKKKNR